jgi:DNA-binding CsgD family transcriptional regulator
MNFHVPDDPAAIFDMIWRLAPQMMRAGGGSLSQSSPSRAREYASRITGETKRLVLDLARSGKHTATEIARITGRRQSTVQTLIKKAGLLVHDGRSATVEETKRQVLDLARTGLHSAKEIIQLSGRSPSTVHFVLKAAGITVPDGRSKEARDSKKVGKA